MSARAAGRWAWLCIGGGAVLAVTARGHTPDAGHAIGALGFYVALCWLVCLWGRAIYGGRGALAAAALIAFLPPMLGHATRADGAAAAACLTLAAVYALARCLLDPSFQAALIAGLGLGVAQLAVHSAIALPGIAIALVLARVATVGRHESPRRVLHGSIASLAIAAGIAFVVCSAASWFRGVAVHDVSARVTDTSILAAFFKTPVPFLILLFARPWRRHRRYSDLALAVSAVWCLVAPGDDGVGGALPAFPFLALLAAANWDDHRSRGLQLAAGGLLALLVLVALMNWPDYGSYVNVLGR